jgi:dTDP-4-amino-4,6-dideoxygalactose transaminase
VDRAIKNRQQVADQYRRALRNVEGISFMEEIQSVRHNYSYFLIFVDTEKYGMTRDELYFKMKENNSVNVN